jgi:S1-C subfamily serine protease
MKSPFELFLGPVARAGRRLSWALGGWGVAALFIIVFATQRLSTGKGESDLQPTPDAFEVPRSSLPKLAEKLLDETPGEEAKDLSRRELSDVEPIRLFTESVPSKPDTPSLERIIREVLPSVVSIEADGRIGSGFFIQPGRVATNYHVLNGRHVAKVKLKNGLTFRARLFRRAETHDLAILELLDGQVEHTVVDLGSVNDLHPGEEVVAIGSPLGLKNTVTRGIVSALRTVDEITLVQTDAAINPGNSGGPLIDNQGRVIGLNTVKLQFGSIGESLALAVAIDHLSDLIAGDVPLTPLPIAWLTIEKEPSCMSPKELVHHQFKLKLEELSNRSNDVDSIWARYQEQCAACPSYQGMHGRDWFVIWDNASLISYPNNRECQYLFYEMSDLAEKIGREMWSAEQQARRDGIEEDDRCFFRRHYQMEWSGWASH